MYTKTSHNVKVTVDVVYLEEQSDPLTHHYIWAYRVQIENLSLEPIRLIGRHWTITDGLGRVQKFSGEGVIGETPLLMPHVPFEYTSSVPLSTPSGIMVGIYVMHDKDEKEFNIDIPAFSLDNPHDTPSLH